MRKSHQTTCAIAAMLWLAAHSFLLAETKPDTPATEPENSVEPAGETAAEAPPQSLRDALNRLELPGIKINIDEWSVDVDATVALRDGLLELVACTKDSKEHESVIAVNAKPSHIHTALLLIGANPGNPAIRKIVGEGEDARFIDLPPQGGMVDVYLVIDTPEGKKEHPINLFMERAVDDFNYDGTPIEQKGEPEIFPDHSFMFTGSVLVEHGEDEPRQYIADYSGNVITLVTFGDEMLSKPGIHDDANHSLMWQVRNELLPELDAPVILRLKPQRAPKPAEPENSAEE